MTKGQVWRRGGGDPCRRGRSAGRGPRMHKGGRARGGIQPGLWLPGAWRSLAPRRAPSPGLPGWGPLAAGPGSAGVGCQGWGGGLQWGAGLVDRGHCPHCWPSCAGTESQGHLLKEKGPPPSVLNLELQGPFAGATNSKRLKASISSSRNGHKPLA